MNGRRRPDDTKPWDLEAGDYMLQDGYVWVCLPSGSGPARLKGWDHTVHEDGTITVTPSILDVGHPDGWHGFLERGVWRSC